jgi:malate dehydrogenase
MTREDLLHKNAAIIRDVCRQVLPHSPEATFVVVSNPLDVMTQLTKEVTDLPAQRVVGMAGVLDTTRMRFFIAEALGVSMEDVVACVLGGHGDSMVPLPRYCSVSGIPIDRLMSEHDIDAIVERTRKGGAEVVDHLQTGSAFYAPASSACQMVEAIVRDKKRVLPCCCYLEGQYGLRDVYVGVPAKLSGQGVETIYELELTSDELSQLTASAEIVRENVRKLQDEAASNNS